MRWTQGRGVLVALAVVLALPGTLPERETGTPTTPVPVPTIAASAAQPGAAQRLVASPLAFEPNVGQANSDVAYVAHGKGYALALTSTALTLTLSHEEGNNESSTSMPGTTRVPATPTTAAVRLALAGANATPQIAAEGPLPGVVNYLVGNDPAGWHTGIPTSRRVRYTDLYPGIDLTVYGTEGGGLEYDALVAPGGDPTAFALSISGTDSITRDETTGDLVLATAAGMVRQHAPVAYQTRGDVRVPVDVRYDLHANGTVGFTVGAYDVSLPLVIDPQVIPAYSTYFGGSDVEYGNGIALDTSGNIYITGQTASTDFPVTNGSTLGGTYDAYATKFNASGTRVYSTYLGGNDADIGWGIAVDTSGDAYVTGQTRSTTFPVTNGSTLGGGYDAFVTKLNASGTRVSSTYLGGSADDIGYGIAVDSSGNAYVTGATNSTNFPVTNGSTNGGSGDAFVTKFDTNSTRVYSTFLGGSGNNDEGMGIALDTSGNFYVTGETNSTDFPVTNGSTFGGNYDAFVTKFNTSGTRVYSIYLGGNGMDEGTGIAVDTSSNAYVTGATYSTNFPVTNGSTNGGGEDAFVARLNASGVRMYSTYLGGSGTDLGHSVAVDTSGNAYVTGETRSTNFPVTNGSTHSVGGFVGSDAFVTKFDASGIRVYSTYLGGNDDDVGDGIAVDASGNAYITGGTASTDFPVTNGSTNSGSFDSFLTKLALAPVPAPLPSPQPTALPAGRPQPLPQPRPNGPVGGVPNPLPSRRP